MLRYIYLYIYIYIYTDTVCTFIICLFIIVYVCVYISESVINTFVKKNHGPKALALLTVLEFLASRMKFSADLTSSRTMSVSEFLREFR